MTAIRTTKIGQVEAATSSQSNDSTMEIDNHVDTKVLCSNFLPVHDFDISVDKFGWDARARSVECPTISGSIAYDHPISEKVNIWCIIRAFIEKY